MSNKLLRNTKASTEQLNCVNNPNLSLGGTLKSLEKKFPSLFLLESYVSFKAIPPRVLQSSHFLV